MFCILVILFSFSSVLSQPLHQGQWKTYTAMSSITDLAVVRSSGNIWAATTGGAFRFTPSDAPKPGIVALRNSDGLSDNDLTAVAADSAGMIWFGGSGGTLDVYTELSEKVKAIRDIELANYARKKIYQISVFAPRVYIATGFGLSIYDKEKTVFTETITKFGTLADQDTVFAVTEANDSIYVVLSGSVAIAAKNAPNLSAPFAWRIVPAQPKTTLNSITTFKGKTIVGGAQGIFEIAGNSLRYISTGDSVSVARIAASQNTFSVIDSRGGRIKESNDLLNFSSSPLPGNISGKNISSFAIANAGAKVFGDGFGGGGVLQPASGSVITKIFPDGPLSNFIFDLHFSGSRNELFATLGGVGISVFEPDSSKWKGWATADGTLPGEGYSSCFYDTVRSKLWLSTGGGALYSLASADPAKRKHYGLAEGIPSYDGSSFTIMGKGTLDNKGNFITTTWALNGEALVKTKDGNTFTATQVNPPGGGALPFGVCIQDKDIDDDLYFVATIDFQKPLPFGVIAIATNGTTVPIAGGNGQKLGSASVNALVVDQDNGLWCGTNVGVDVLTHSFQGVVPVFNKPRRLTFTDQQLVKAIAVDGVGNKWVGTDNGVFVLNADGSDSLAHFTTANSPLIDNSVQTIAIDTRKGEAYIGTTKGISRVSSIYQEGASNYAKIYVYPNPVIQNSDDKIKVTITGLAGGSTVKIFTASGRLVTTIDGSQLGSTVTWNGRDENGKLLATGVYVAAAASSASADYGEAKFVVIRK